ncbi:MAG: hypothetical protein KAH34_06770 [Ketobacter sp.]|nr:hypothetical protein [Ketobacter sp.]MEC8810370.1 flagellar biosynthesis protein FlgE [Pseudomonadota bacterium]
MVIGSVLNNGVAGIQKGLSEMNKASAQVAQVATSEDPATDLAESAVSLLQSKLQVQASAKVVQTASDTMGSIIDIEV